VRHHEDSVVENCCFVVCCAEEGGGGLRTCTPTRVNNCFFDRCKVKGNSASSCDGGAIKIQTTSEHPFSISSCTFVGCISEIGGGGAISFMGTGSLQIEHTTFFSCIANGTGNPAVGGGLLIYSRGVSCLNCSWLNGRSNNAIGGAIAEKQDNNVDSTHVVNLEDCSFISNYANSFGGAIGLKLMSLTCTRCVFIHNYAAGGGSAVAGDLKYQFIY
jgi:predicted outer membrane repeat protein